MLPVSTQQAPRFRTCIWQIVLFLLLLPLLSQAQQISISTSGVPYTQDFNTLASGGVGNTTVPTGWYFSESASNANNEYSVGAGSSATGDTYSFGEVSSSERAFGGLRSGNVVPIIGASFTNNTGQTITQLTIAYTGEQWRLGTIDRPDRLDFQYSLNASSPTTGSYINVDNLDFTSPTTSSVGALVGNAAANKTQISYSITGLTIGAGSTFWIRWTDLEATGADDGLAVDDFSLTASTNSLPTNPTPVIASISPSTIVAGSAPFTLTVNGTNFIAGSVVNFNGSPRATTFVSATQLTAAILAGDIANDGNYSVVVTNPTPGGGDSNSLDLIITPAIALPSVLTTAVSGIAATSAESGGNVTAEGSSAVTSRGVVIGTAATPRLGAAGVTTIAAGTGGLGSFTSSLTNLTSGSTYYVAAYATNSTGTSYGADQQFTVNPLLPVVTSIDPASGPIGTMVTITGLNLSAVTEVTFNGVAGTGFIGGATSITVTVPAGLPLGEVDIVLIFGIRIGTFEVTPAPLPVTLVSFTAERQDEAVRIAWATASEKNNDYFDVQRSATGKEFRTLTTVKGEGTTSGLQTYVTLDRQPLPGLAYYRLRQVDTDGTANFSPVVTVAASKEVVLYPNPARSELHLLTPTAAEGAHYRVLSVLGSVVLQGKSTSNDTTLDVSKLPAGLYHLEVTSGAGRTVRKFVKE